MGCAKPLKAWQTDQGGIVWSEKGKIARELELPCGKCRLCRLSLARSWAIRCVHESKMHKHNVFATLTYDEKHYTPSLDYSHVQRWLKRLRKTTGQNIRYFVTGEYGDIEGRAHWHALLFGLRLDDRKKWSDKYWTSETLNKTWGAGSVMCGDVTYQSAAYCAKYAIKKRSGPIAEEYYTRVHRITGEVFRVEPEMAHMSLKPAIGKTWFQKYWKDVYMARDGVVIDNKVLPPPTYYKEMLKSIDMDLSDEREYDRYVKSEEFAKDCTPERLEARERVAAAREKLNKRRIG
ncbi:MAG: replication initiator protein [Microvirus sp.]|nr:MAG: replication initiator protein [Microvirus sp.]